MIFFDYHGVHYKCFMVDHNVGASTADKYKVKKVDSDYLDNECYSTIAIEIFLYALRII